MTLLCAGVFRIVRNLSVTLCMDPLFVFPLPFISFHFISILLRLSQPFQCSYVNGNQDWNDKNVQKCCSNVAYMPQMHTESIQKRLKCAQLDKYWKKTKPLFWTDWTTESISSTFTSEKTARISHLYAINSFDLCIYLYWLDSFVFYALRSRLQ